MLIAHLSDCLGEKSRGVMVDNYMMLSVEHF